MKKLVDKWFEFSKRYGVRFAIRRAGSYLLERAKLRAVRKQQALSTVTTLSGSYKDVLIINGCTLPHPYRYRTEHLAEQLFSQAVSHDIVDWLAVSSTLVKQYNAFILFRCEWNEAICELVSSAKLRNKPVYYDIDDLIFDRKYVNSLPYVKTLNKGDAEAYYRHVSLVKRAMELCDYGVGATPVICNAMLEIVKDTFQVPNVASEEMLVLSERTGHCRENERKTVKLGYFSGSITHNSDIVFILPALKRLMEVHPELELVVVGYLDIPEALMNFSARIHSRGFIDWRELPELISSVDINLAPLESSLFNEGKSENKWTEAALVGVPTVASSVGGFLNVIEHGVNGFFCSDPDHWFLCLNKLISDRALRVKIGEQARKDALSYKTTFTNASQNINLIQSRLPERIGFVVPSTQISGGINVILRHASVLRKAGHIVTLISEHTDENDCVVDGVTIEVISRVLRPIEVEFDVLVATLWTTTKFVSTYPRTRDRLYLVQNYETDFYATGDSQRFEAEQTYRLTNLRYITISRWCHDWLYKRYKKDNKYCPNGIDLEIFYPTTRNFSGKIRILVEGSSVDEYKNVDESFEILEDLDRDQYEVWYISYNGTPKSWYRYNRFFLKVPNEQMADLYRSCHILLKTSLVESFSYPPLEMMATGGIAVVASNGGNAEYLRSMENSLVYEPGETEYARKLIHLVRSDPELREKLINGGLHTAQERSWKMVEERILNLYLDTPVNITTVHTSHFSNTNQVIGVTV